MRRAFQAFTDALGLAISLEKSVIYFGNVDLEIQERILMVTGFNRGTFPFRYLGVLITSKRLTKADCDVIVDKMLKRIICWSSRHLFYVARVVLVNYVLLSLHTYWAQVFLIPKGFTKRIIQICRSYLWEGKVFLSKPPPVAWNKVCMPKVNGGLGIRDCITWNISTMGKYVWQISQKEDLLWIKWVQNVYIQDREWWGYQAPSNVSWV